MITALSMLAGDIIFEIVRFIIFAALIVLAVFIGSRLRKVYDKSKAKKEAAEAAVTMEAADSGKME